MSRARGSDWLAVVLVIAGVLCLGTYARNALRAAAFQDSQSRALDAELRAAGPDRAAHARGQARGRVLGRIEIPRLHISAIVAEGTDPALLNSAIGHVFATALPGQAGNCALAGHRDTFLRRLENVRAHDIVRLVTLGGTYTYEVEWAVVVGPNRVDMLERTANPSVTLITCYPFHLIGPAPDRFAVRARLVSPTAANGPGSRPAAGSPVATARS